MFRVTVTYNDGTTETFEADSTCDAEEGGAIIIHMEDNTYVAISPFAYRKVKEEEVE